jgi:hypothetical protein
VGAFYIAWDVKTEHGPDNEAPADERAGYR